MENKYLITDGNLVVVRKPDWLVKATVIQKSAIAAPKINQPEFSNVLCINDGMAPGDFWHVEHDHVLRRSADRTITLYGNLPPTGFQPGSLPIVRGRNSRLIFRFVRHVCAYSLNLLLNV
jgi:hypothetical protein